MDGKIIFFLDRIVLPSIILLFTFSGFLPRVESQELIQSAGDKKFSLHEWGVFTVPRRADWLKQDMLAEWQGFPEFFHGTLPNRYLVYRGPVTKPVIFFHGGKKFPIDLLIRFSTGQIAEPFIYYDGLMNPPLTPQITRTANGITLNIDSDHDWLDVQLIERSLDGTQLSLAQIDRIENGLREKQVIMRPATVEDITDLATDFGKSLVNSGLNHDEARSLLDVWSQGLFQRPGLTVFYRIPQTTCDDWIPLHFNPQPESIVRVGLVVHQHLESELAENVTRLIRELGPDQYGFGFRPKNNCTASAVPRFPKSARLLTATTRKPPLGLVS